MIALVFWSFVLVLAPITLAAAWKLIFGTAHWIALEVSGAFESA